MPGNFFRPGNPAAPGGTIANQRTIWTIVSGGDPGVPTIHQAHGIHAMRGFQTMLIGGASLSGTRAATDPTGPSAPQGFRVIENADGSYTLAWNAPAFSGGAGTSILGYQVTFTNALGSQFNTHVNTPETRVPVGATTSFNHNQIINVDPATAAAHATALGLPESYAFTYGNEHIDLGLRAFFRVRALNGRLQGTGGDFWQRTANTGGFNVAQVPGSVRNSVSLQGAGAASAQNQFNVVLSGRGAWAPTIIVDKPGVTRGVTPYIEWRAAQPLTAEIELAFCEYCEECEYCEDCELDEYGYCPCEHCHPVEVACKCEYCECAYYEYCEYCEYCECVEYSDCVYDVYGVCDCPACEPEDVIDEDSEIYLPDDDNSDEVNSPDGDSDDLSSDEAEELVVEGTDNG